MPRGRRNISRDKRAAIAIQVALYGIAPDIVAMINNVSEDTVYEYIRRVNLRQTILSDAELFGSVQSISIGGILMSISNLFRFR